MRKKKDIPVIENFEITGVAAEGKSLGRWNDLVSTARSTAMPRGISSGW